MAYINWDLLKADGIVRDICTRYRMTRAHLESRRKSQRFAMARQEAMYEIRMATSLSFPKIGRLFNRDHTTVIHAVQKITALRARQKALATSIAVNLPRVHIQQTNVSNAALARLAQHLVEDEMAREKRKAA